MKQYITLALLVSFYTLQPLWVSASLSQTDIRLNNLIEWLRGKWVIATVGQDDNTRFIFHPPEKNFELYRVSDTITRREALKVALLSYKHQALLSQQFDIPDTCLWLFEDMKADDWGCKYAEYALKHDIIAHNTHFRPDDSITHIEALKILMLVHGYPRDMSQNHWQQGYIQAAKDIFILDEWNNQNNQDILRWEMFLYIHNIWGYNEIKRYIERSVGDISVVRSIRDTLDTQKKNHERELDIKRLSSWVLLVDSYHIENDWKQILVFLILHYGQNIDSLSTLSIENVEEFRDLLDTVAEVSEWKIILDDVMREQIIDSAVEYIDFETDTLFLYNKWIGLSPYRDIYTLIEDEIHLNFIISHLAWDGWYWVDNIWEFAPFFQMWIFPKSDKEIRFTHYLEPRYLIVE